MYADILSIFTWVWRLKLLFLIGLMSEDLSRSLCSSVCVGRETLDAKDEHLRLDSATASHESWTFPLTFTRKKRKKSVVFNTLLLIPLNSTESCRALSSSMSPRVMCEGKGEVPGVRANVTWKKAVLISKEVEAQSCSLPRVVWVCSRQSWGRGMLSL